METKYRYPGPRSFTENDRELFFGRNKEIRKLTELMVIEKLVVLFGKSGYGKTSLLQAGVIPRLEEKEAHQVLEVFLGETEEPETSPLQQFLEQLKGHMGEGTFISEKLDIETELPYDEAAKLWYYAKNIQLSNEEMDATTIVFDHFEKLFVYRELQAKALARALSYLLQSRPPKSVRRLITDKTTSNPDYFSEEEVSSLLKPLNVKVLISIDHSQVAALDMLKSILPTIFKYTYELQPLNEFQAVEILQKPAKKEGPYKSPVFSYSEEAIKSIVEDLKDDKSRRIETFQLQLIGQHAEEVVINKHNKKPDPSGYELTTDDLWKSGEVVEEYYKETISGLPKHRKKARHLVEKVLIVNGIRVPMADTVIRAKDIPIEVVGTLTDKRLLRAERNSVGGLSYELSHDTLVSPIIKTSKARKRKKDLQKWLFWGLVVVVLVAIWGGYEKNRADGLQEDVIELQEEVSSLNGKIDSLEAKVRSLEEALQKMDTTGIPTVTITGIANGQDFSTSDTIPVNLVASDSDGSITKHEIFVNDAKVATTGAEYTPHLITNLEEGSYRIRAKVTDNEGGTAGDVVNITAGNPANKLPAVTISNPNNGQDFSVGSTVSIDLSASDPDGSITKHEIFVNDSSVVTFGSDYTAHQIENIEAGRYRIRARVTDNGEVPASAEDIVNITVEGLDNMGPTLSIASPNNGQEFAFGSSINVNLIASDADGNIAQHEIFVNDSLAASFASEFSVHELSNMTDGNYTIRAKVTDNGGVAVEDVVNITVRPKNIEPNVSFVSPTDGQKFDFGSTVTVNLIASDPNGSIANHEIFVNGSSVATYGSEYTPYQISTLVAGEHSITTRVTDDEGATVERTVNFTMGSKEELVHEDWLERLKTLKVRLENRPGLEHTMVMQFEKESDTKKVGEWEFDEPGEVHLIAIRKLPLIPRVFDARKDDALFVLLVDGKSYVFYGFTGHFDTAFEGSSKDRNKTGFIAEGQHKFKVDNTGSERLLTPYGDGVLLFQDRDKNRELSARDIRAGLYPEPIESANILWHPVGNSNSLTGIQYISEESYLDPKDEIVSNSDINAYDIFVDRIWGNPEMKSLFYTVVDWSDFDDNSKEFITESMNRVRS